MEEKSIGQHEGKGSQGCFNHGSPRSFCKGDAWALVGFGGLGLREPR